MDNTAPLAVDTSANKRIMLVSDFYYGQFEGDGTEAVQKTNTTFKCQSCLKILKSNVRYDDLFSCPEVTQGWGHLKKRVDETFINAESNRLWQSYLAAYV